jgi:hypothetical protein
MRHFGKIYPYAGNKAYTESGSYLGIVSYVDTQAVHILTFDQKEVKAHFAPAKEAWQIKEKSKAIKVYFRG